MESDRSTATARASHACVGGLAAVNKPSSKNAAATDGGFEHIQAFFDTTRGHRRSDALRSLPWAKKHVSLWSAAKQKAYPTCCTD